MKRIHILFILLLVFSLVALLLSLLIEYRQNLIQQEEFYKSHILGGFSIDTPQKAANAAADGIQVTFKYGQPPSGCHTESCVTAHCRKARKLGLDWV